MKKDEIYEKLDKIYCVLDGVSDLILGLANAKDNIALGENCYHLLSNICYDNAKELKEIIRQLE